MPCAIGPFANANSLFVLSSGIEQAQFDVFGALREQREIDAVTVPGGASGKMRASGRELQRRLARILLRASLCAGFLERRMVSATGKPNIGTLRCA